jgi:hypothetical protein
MMVFKVATVATIALSLEIQGFCKKQGRDKRQQVAREKKIWWRKKRQTKENGMYHEKTYVNEFCLNINFKYGSLS